MNITHINILSIPVNNQETAKDFYTNKLNFKVLRDDTFGDQRWLQLTIDGAQTSITLVTHGMPAGSQKGVVLATHDIHADHATLTAQGVELSPIQEMPWGMSATFADPDGNGWVLQQLTS